MGTSENYTVYLYYCNSLECPSEMKQKIERTIIDNWKEKEAN